jgi:hypothetical protein
MGQGGDDGFAVADPVPGDDVLACGGGGELMQPAGYLMGTLSTEMIMHSQS